MDVGSCPGVRQNNESGGQMRRYLGFLLVGLAALGAIAQRSFGIHTHLNETLHFFLGPNSSGTFGSPVGQAVIYGVLLFVAASGLVLVATGKRHH